MPGLRDEVGAATEQGYDVSGSELNAAKSDDILTRSSFVSKVSAIGVTLFVPAAGYAQVAPPQRVTELSAAMTVRHDSNVARTDAAFAATRGLKPSDQRATPTLRLVLARPFGRNGLSLTADAGYDFYRRNKRLNRERVTIAGAGRLGAGPCDLTLSPSFSRRQSDPADIAALAIGGIDSIRNTETVQNYASELRCGRAYGLRPIATLEYARGDNSNDRRRISNYRTTRYGGGIGYASPALGDFSLQYLRTDTDYPDRPAGYGSGGFTVDRFQLGAARELGSVLTARGTISYLDLNPNDAGADAFNGIGWSASLTAVPAPDLRLSAGLGRDVSPSLGTDALYQINRSYSLGVDYAFSSLVGASLVAARDERKFEGSGTDFGIDFGPALTRSIQHSVTGSLTYALSPRLGLAADGGYQLRRANGAVYDYDNRFAALRISVKL